MCVCRRTPYIRHRNKILIIETLYGPVPWGLLGSRTELIWTIVARTIKLDGSNQVQVNTSPGLIQGCPVACWSNECGFVPGVIYQSILKMIFQSFEFILDLTFWEWNCFEVWLYSYVSVCSPALLTTLTMVVLKFFLSG